MGKKISKEQTISEYHRIKQKLRHQLSQTEYLKESRKLSKITHSDLRKIYGTNAYSKLQKDAGDKPKTFLKPPRSKEEFLIIWGQMVRKLGRIPKIPDWEYHKVKPVVQSYSYKFNKKWTEINEEFLKFAKNKSEWEDVVSLIPMTKKSEVNEIKAIEYIPAKISYHHFIPPIIADLNKLGQTEGKSLEFEKKIGLAFQILGYKVEQLGQGSGRNPDGIAYAQRDHYAIIYDAKSRKEGYSLGTDDRTIREYINKYRRQLVKEGYENIYFLVISYKFVLPSQKVFTRLYKETHVPLVFVSTDQMLGLVSRKIEKPLLIDLEELETLFIASGPIDVKKFDVFLMKINKKEVR